MITVRADKHKDNDKILKYTINLLCAFDDLENICRNDIFNNCNKFKILIWGKV